MLTLACIDGGIICVPTLLGVLAAILAWIRHRGKHCDKRPGKCDH